MFKKGVLLLIMIMVLSSVYSQKSYTLEQCIRQALATNIDMQLNNVNTKLVKERLKQRYRNLLPTIGAGTNYSIRYGRSVDPNTNTISNTDFFSNNYSIDASLVVFQGFLKQYQISAAKWNKLSALAEGEQQKFSLIQQLLPVFYEVLYTQDLLKLTEEELVIAEKLFKVTNKKFELGQQSQAAVFDVEADVQAAHLNVVKAKNALEKVSLNLKQLMNIEKTSITFINDFETKGISNIVTQNERKSRYVKAKEVSPILKQLSFSKNAFQKQLHASQSELYPLVSVFGGYSTGYFETNIDQVTGNTIGFQKQIQDNASQYVGVSLQISVFNQWNTRSKIKQQRLDLEQRELVIKQNEQELYQFMLQLEQEDKALRNEFNWSTKKQKAVMLSYKTSEKKFQHGLIALLDVLQVKNELFKSKVENIRVQQQLQMNQKMMDLYTGKFTKLYQF
ncbi:TolC family protein [Aquimarina agarilytica]|uniref:TolC family protein n=1 Tax=Aquimarina agarilytica TaxID=1087449 RepID=UPI0002895C39|nr:TolC family protein [Aquimarina agarilytica]